MTIMLMIINADDAYVKFENNKNNGVWVNFNNKNIDEVRAILKEKYIKLMKYV